MSAQIALFDSPSYNFHIMAISFGDKFKQHRMSKGMSIFRLSQITGVPEGNIVAIEKGRRPASDAVLQKIADIPEMDISFEKLKAWQILGKATREELLYLIGELENIKTHEQNF